MKLKTSKEWNDKHKIEIHDPDGWDRSNYQYSFYEEKISEDEFIKRVSYSTVTLSKKVLEIVKNSK